jgi:hypothetical protein
MGLLFSNLWNRFNTLDTRMLMVGLDAAGKVIEKAILYCNYCRFSYWSVAFLFVTDYHPVQVETR